MFYRSRKCEMIVSKDILLHFETWFKWISQSCKTMYNTFDKMK